MSIRLYAVIIPLILLVITCTTSAENPIKQSDPVTSASTKSSVTKTESLQTLASRWSLDSNEYQRYLDLMNGPLGKWSPDIDPLLALGMYSTSAQQQQHYAELYAQQEFELTRRTMEFQRAYRAAFNRLYPNIKMLDKQLLEPYYNHQQQEFETRQTQREARAKFEEGDRLLVFLPPECSNCTNLISQLMDLVSTVKNSGVDIYVLNVLDDTAVRRWAQIHHIQKSWLNTQQLTLNRDEGLYQRLQSRIHQRKQNTTPIFLKRNDRFYQLNPAELGL